MTVVPDGGFALAALYWRAEILQALYWMRGEGLASVVEPARLAEFLVADGAVVMDQMRSLCLDGFLAQLPGTPVRYELTAAGSAEGGRSFQDEFAELTRRAHYACGPGCWCHDPDHVGEPCPNEPQPVAPEPQPEEEPDDDA